MPLLSSCGPSHLHEKITTVEQAGLPEGCLDLDSWCLFEMSLHFIVMDSVINLLP